MTEQKKIGVMVVDDSAVVREVMSALISLDPELELIATAADPIFAMEKMKKVWPDVIVLDIEMPRMDGITFLRKLASEHPTPVVICSVFAEREASVTMQAFSLGAVEIITKPKVGVKDYLNESSTLILDAIKGAARADVRSLARIPRLRPNEVVQGPLAIEGKVPRKDLGGQEGSNLIVIGASTGGTTAIEYILSSLPADVPGILIVQHMPERFTKAFADRLNQHSRLTIREAEDGDLVTAGTALIAPGGRHMRLMPMGAMRVQIFDGPLVNRHRPSVDVLFESTAERVHQGAVLGIILTGMGNDGSRGLLRLRERGASTIGQDEQSCVVYGMPAEAAKIGAVERVVSLESVPEAIMEFRARVRKSKQGGK